ncbi:helix-turn-helix domain-containing protein [Hyphococcus flavus]|uniref:Helix-turn-helix domain-containing protein n=1 Tax=Hyphococcus flavus TaxID=1866326 RepID=A0AAE9ZAD8_9PROT|nr:helix-turn-helix domain-containing protein [Hyphococcus flavus]WDI30544.1 helix-turn-helix domain-containing protein [Hyphococcus flavus]
MNLASEYPSLLNTEQAARYLGVSASFLAKARVNGSPSIPFTRIGVAVRYRKSDLDAFIDENMKTTTSEPKAA